MANLSSRGLLDLLVRSINDAGWNCLIQSETKPFRLRIYDESSRGVDVAIYAWNCTHGGGAKRAADEYRIQLTSVIPRKVVGATTVILGWHAGYGVFAGFDIDWHTNQGSQSPSIQIREDALKGAHLKAFSVSVRNNGELAVAFRPEFLVDYILNSASLHERGTTSADLNLLNDVGAVDDENIAAASTNERKLVISTIVRRFRAADFRSRVLNAYGRQCAFCGVQLRLIDAAHIIPVASDLSTDETRNGIALCKIHHSAYDQNLVSFAKDYSIQISSSERVKLSAENLLGGFDGFKKNLLSAIILPADRRDHPLADYVEKSRHIRRWVP